MRKLRAIRTSAVFCFAILAACGGCDDEPKDFANNSTNNATNNTTNATSNATNNTSNTTTGTSGTSGNPDLIDQTRDEYCMGDGPPIIVGDLGMGREALCTGDIAQTTFRYGLCICEDFKIGNTLFTDGFNSALGTSDDKSGAVGVNGDFEVGNSVDVGGTLWVSGAGGVTAGNGLTINHYLHANGDVTSTTILSVAEDATVGGDITANNVTIGGTLTQPASSMVDANNSDIGSTAELPVNVDEPCDCNDIFDIAAFTANHKVNNHNADIGLDPATLSNGGSSVTIDLPCGIFYLDGGSVTNSIEFNVSGRTALFIGGDISAGNSIRATLEDGAEFDLFVEGNVNTGNSMTLGSAEQPAAARMYVGGDAIDFGNGGQFAGNLYAPRATVTVGNSIEIFGSMFVGEFVGGNSFIVHYDSAILSAGDDCETNGGGGSGGGSGGDMCTECEDCGNQACNDGVCGACETNADCCSPLICNQGECILVIQ